MSKARRNCFDTDENGFQQFLRAFDTKALPNSIRRKVRRKSFGIVLIQLGFGWALLGYNTGFVRAELIAKSAPLWYNNMDRQAKSIFLPAACAAPLCFRKAALCLNTALANHCKQVCSLALWKHKQAERFHITEKECILTVGIRCAEVAGRRELRRM